ncbi:RecB family exonuclease [Anatilimnocola floriformis]|uniref:RecB family exonuclease n=1 Tax=Anatilimnocola floriformis TaxID=2948575 RepID=UPI0020C54FB5|nr:PD-(D/E)XK nuclease family protein [Anatilimnocola floriformis]
MTALLFDARVEAPSARAPPQPVPPVAPRDYISFSAIRTYQQCPLRYFFRYIAGIPEETLSAALVFGSAIHRAIEHHFRKLLESSKAATPEEMEREYQLEWQAQSLPIRFSKDEQADSFDDLAKRMITAFAQSDLAKPAGRILAIEETLRGQLVPGLPDLLGKVDLILETPTELLVSDWKTSRSKYTQDQVEESAAQLLLYGELAKDFAPSKRLRLQFGVLTKTKEVSVEVHRVTFEQAQLDRTKRVVERVWQAIKAAHFFPAPSQMNCPGCPYRDPCRKWPG